MPTIYLHNFWHTDKCSDIETMTQHEGFGCHIQILWCTPELVKQMHDAGKMVAVWVDATCEEYEENDDFYRKIYDLGVDMFTTDHCLRAHKVFSEYHAQKVKDKKEM